MLYDISGANLLKLCELLKKKKKHLSQRVLLTYGSVDRRKKKNSLNNSNTEKDYNWL